MKTKGIFRVLAFVLSFVLICCCFTACSEKSGIEDNGSFQMGNFTLDGEETDSSSSEGDSPTSDTSSKSKDAGSTTQSGTTSLTAAQVLAKMPKMSNKEIKVCCWEDYKNTSYGNAVEAFEKKTGMTITPQLITKKTYDTEVAALIASGNSPDLVLLIKPTTGSVKNLQPISNSGFNFNDTAWDKESMKDFTFGGRQYGMLLKNSPKQNVCVILYNKKALKKAEMEDPYNIWKKNPKSWTWDKLWEMGKSFVDKNGNKEGYYGINFGIEEGYLRSFGAGLYGYDKDAGKYVSLINKKETVDRYTILMDKIDKKIAAGTYDSNSFIMGYTLFSMTFSSSLEKRNSFYTQLGDDLGSVPIPTDSTTVPGFEYCAWGIPIGAKNAAAVPYFVRWTFGPDLYDMNDFYKNDQAKTTVEEMLSRGAICENTGWSWEVWNALTKGTASQVKTVLDSYSSTIADTVAQFNEDIKSFAK